MHPDAKLNQLTNLVHLDGELILPVCLVDSITEIVA